MYKLIALDMDGTLLNDDKTISEENKEAIKMAKSLGYKVVLSTGRPLRGIERYLEELNLVNEDDYAIAFNGGLVQNTKTGEILGKKLLKFEDLDRLYKLSKEFNVNIHMLSIDECITPKKNPYSDVEVNLNQIKLIEKNFSELPKDTVVVKIMMIDSKDNLDNVEKLLPKDIYDDYCVTRSSEIFLEFSPKDIHKGMGLKILSDHLGLKKEELIAVGDAGNDISMIEHAGLGVAMGNAFPSVKECADYITDSNENSGVAKVIHKFMINQ
ncbi:Cof-type HAD-IIB family hydrolase [Clostridium felsineum]|uniref:Cof-type HAD-IIB family hydrolase n=1 Tax=Clostridium felsineum TaxID=36839 RepID=UPI00098C758E|nr:Cof-type HAD-IIB family hydrolase [Clostridium felsineum]URZ01795.1 Sugar phosphatase YidA [Clostridium felsineum]